MRWRTTLIVGFALLSLPAAADEAPRAGHDWPCQQELVPALTPAMMWTGPPIDDIGDWHAEPRVVELVQKIAPRDVSVEQGEAAIGEFTRGLGADRTRPVLLAFAGLLDETNRERAEVIERIKQLGERQRNLAALIGRLTAELDAMPANPQGEAAASRAELQQRWTFTSRTYVDVQRTMRYACQVPAALDARLRAYTHALEAALK
jgi:uncharacterized protein YukE